MDRSVHHGMGGCLGRQGSDVSSGWVSVSDPPDRGADWRLDRARDGEGVVGAWPWHPCGWSHVCLVHCDTTHVSACGAWVCTGGMAWAFTDQRSHVLECDMYWCVRTLLMSALGPLQSVQRAELWSGLKAFPCVGQLVVCIESLMPQASNCF